MEANSTAFENLDSQPGSSRLQNFKYFWLGLGRNESDARRTHEDFRQGLSVGGNQAFQPRDEWGGLECLGSEPQRSDNRMQRARSIREGSKPVGRRTQDQPHRIPARWDAKYPSASCDQCDSASPRDEWNRALDVSGCAPRRPGVLGWNTAWGPVARKGRAGDSASRGSDIFRRRISAAHDSKTGRRSTGSQPSVAQAQVQETSSNRPRSSSRRNAQR